VRRRSLTANAYALLPAASHFTLAEYSIEPYAPEMCWIVGFEASAVVEMKATDKAIRESTIRINHPCIV
jgi:hypothetical protein